MSEWKTQPLSDVAKVIDSLHKTPTYEEDGFPMVRVTDIKGGYLDLSETFKVSKDTYEEFAKKHKPKHGDLLFSRVGTYGSVSFVKDDAPFCLGQNTVFIVPKINPYFLFYFLNSPYARYQIDSFATGSTQKTISLASINSIKVFTPSREEQETIAAVLSCLDRKIENLRRQNETLERIAQTLFKHWFIDFEFPKVDGKPYKSSGGEMVRSELGEIPAGWSLLELGDVATNHSETHKFENNSKIVFINTGDVLEGNFLHHDYSPVETLPGQAKKKIRQNDILYSEIRPINRRFAYVNFSHNLDDYVVSTKFMVVRSNGKILPRLLYLILKKDSTIQEFHHIADSRSGTFPQITFESVSKFPIVIPEISLQENLMRVITPLIEKREFNVQKIKTLTKTRDVLLPRLMSGKLRITE